MADDSLTAMQQLAAASGGVTAPPEKQGRKAFLAACDLDPGSLVGSWFHRLENDCIVWQGQVVGEPQAGVYLMQIDKLMPGASDVQRLFKMDVLTNDDDGYDWRFYDSESKARAAYAEWVAR